ncbi:RHS repeat-associated core domain-containing protein [Chryseobacterium phocaeense]|uniref:RHS repeat-associated core domain-containing protein n=1 Tax=Chryseobacterium phocaeense TaxID=1816690 RepID=UPI0009B9F186|nr:RHS repeat-associated core domain-containing protein [Chryseobacterium phocaeense]
MQERLQQQIQPTIISITERSCKKETGWNDYGARMYMSDIGRWGVLDNYSETYNSLSPYNYVAGNPVKYIDINGEWIYINDTNGTKYRYSNGGAQHQVEGKWVNVNETTKLSEYVMQTIAGLSYLDHNTSIGNTMINYFNQEGTQRDIHFYSTSGDSQVRHGISNIIDLKIFPSDGVWTTSGKDLQYSPLYTTIAHEMGHVYGYFALGEVDTSEERFGDRSTTAEIFGTHVENIVRAETFLSLRTHYGKTCLGKTCIPNTDGRLIDNVGNSIYYNSNGSQIKPIPNIESVRNINNNILQNKYNYHGAALYNNWQRFKNRAQ